MCVCVCVCVYTCVYTLFCGGGATVGACCIGGHASQSWKISTVKVLCVEKKITAKGCLLRCGHWAGKKQTVRGQSLFVFENITEFQFVEKQTEQKKV